MNPIVQEITIKAPAERIFEALTNPDERLKWWWRAKGILRSHTWNPICAPAANG